MIQIVTKYKELQIEIESLQNEMRETTFQIEEDTRLSKGEKLKRLQKQKKKLYSLPKLRHTVIVGIPEQDENLQKIEEDSKEDETSILHKSESRPTNLLNQNEIIPVLTSHIETTLENDE